MSNWTCRSEAWSSNLSEIPNCKKQFLRSISDKLELHASEQLVQFDIGQQTTKLRSIRTAKGGTMTPASEAAHRAKQTVAEHGGTMTEASRQQQIARSADKRAQFKEVRQYWDWDHPCLVCGRVYLKSVKRCNRNNCHPRGHRAQAALPALRNLPPVYRKLLLEYNAHFLKSGMYYNNCLSIGKSFHVPSLPPTAISCLRLLLSPPPPPPLHPCHFPSPSPLLTTFCCLCHHRSSQVLLAWTMVVVAASKRSLATIASQ